MYNLSLQKRRIRFISNYMRKSGWLSSAVRYENVVAKLEKEGRVQEIIDLIDDYSMGACREFFRGFPQYMKDNTRKYSNLVMENVAASFDSAMASRGASRRVCK